MPSERLNQLKGRRNLLAVFLTAGYPNLEDTGVLSRAIQSAGADILEIGMPFSDPIADGPTIQAANTRALQNGMTLAKVLEQVRELRKDVSVPVVLMGSLNPVIQFGFVRFAKEAASAGVDAVILPDLPLEEIEVGYNRELAEAGLGIIGLVTPQTPPERVRRIDQASSGFLYAVTQSSTTGGSAEFDEGMRDYFRRLKLLHLENPVLAGFGIGNRDQFLQACAYADGAIVGSAFLRALETGEGPIEERARNFVKGMLSQ